MFITRENELMNAVEACDLDTVRSLVRLGHDVLYRTPEDWSLLDQATLDDDEDMIQFLISKGASH